MTGIGSSTDLSTVQGSPADSQVTDSVVHVDRQTTWIDALFASLRPRDHHVSDEEIFEILKAGSDGGAAAELFAARRITFPMYCVWKAKYRHLHLEELREVRRRELWRARCVLVALLAGTVLGAGGIVFALGRAAQANITGVAGVKAADLEVRATSSTRLPIAESAAERNRGGYSRTATAPAAAPKAPPVEHGSRSDESLPTTEPRYKIQVKAAPSLQEGRVLVERLASAGYPAYLSRAVVSNVELFRVRVGPFDSFSAAEKIASQLQRDGYNGAWIAR